MAERAGHLGRVQAAERRRFAIDRPLVGEQLARLAPVEDLGCAATAGETAASDGNRADFPRERFGGGADPHVEHALAVEMAADQFGDRQPFTLTEFELSHVDRPAAQADALGGDLADPSASDEDAAPPHRDDVAVDPRRAAAEVEHDVDDLPDVGAVGADQRQAGHSRNVDDAIAHTGSVELPA